MSKTKINFLNTTVFKKLPTNVYVKQLTDKVIYTASQVILIPLRKLLDTVRH